MKLRDWLRPSRRAAALMIKAARGGRGASFARSLLISLHSSDVQPGAQFDAPPILPHPFGIVVGRGVRVGRDVKIWHGVTLGSDGRNGYPTIEAGARLLPYATVVGAVTVGEAAMVGAHALVIRSVVAGGVVRANAAEGDGSDRQAQRLAGDQPD